ncbi:J domain-containing protein [Evansella halocellulosilytica]|uniref:J domain-containing protein n=1 Tax=Evansella halocellulosilytica TaxID=2011013 RepID=UPI000BB72288|nr:J domain-containing protein [Evansella halocellulosilytica]
MLELNKAFKTLNISEDASKEEIEEKYFILIRRYKNQLDQQQNDLLNIDEINKAYNVIQDHFDQDELAKMTENSPRKSRFREKAEHIWDYYKLHIIFGLIAMFILTSLTRTSLQAWQEQRYLNSLPPADLTITFYGEFRDVDSTKVEDEILSLFPEWERVIVNVITSPNEMTSQYSFGEQQRSMIELMEDESDLFIVDMPQFSHLAEQGLFYSFGTFESVLKDSVHEEKLVYVYNDQEQKELLGLDISNHSLFNDSDITTDENIILALHSRSENNQDHSLHFVEHLIEQE